MALKQLVWNTVENRAEALDAPVDVRAGSVSVVSGTTSVDITFSSAIADLNYAPVPMWLNTTDALPQYQPLTITAFSTAGFTVSWNAPVDSSNYKIVWTCTQNV